MEKERADIVLVSRGIFPSRVKASEAIKNGEVTLGGKVLKKPSEQVSKDAVFVVTGDTLKYVSRGGFKLEAGIEAFNIDLNGKTVVDMGSSTGGFTDCALQHGAKKVFAIDIGSNQLVEKLRNDNRVVSMENTDIRDVGKSVFDESDFVVADLSFVSEVVILDSIKDKLKDQKLVILIKPQFECGKALAKKYKGVIRDYLESKEIAEKTIKKIESLGFKCSGLIDSPIKGGDGNSEFVAFLQKS